MERFPKFGSAAVACALLGLLCLGATPDDATLPSPVAGDVAESYRLLTSTAYAPVDPQALLAAASDALADAARKHGVTIAPPALHVEAENDATLAELDDAISTSAQAAHTAPTDLAYVAIDAMAKALNDRYTQFFTPDEFKEFNNALDPQRISGIGVIVQPDPASGNVAIAYVVPGTPADRAGLQAGDVLTAIDGSPTKGLSIDAVSGMLRGKAGTVVAVTVQRSAGTAPTVISITRDEVQPPTVVFKMLPGGIGYVWVLVFGRATPAEFDTAVTRLKALGARGLVLDLRNDGGGYVTSALDISSRFIANKALVTVEERDRHTTIDSSADPSITLPVTVLVNQYTASASEITAGALQDDGIGALVGTKTFGKGVMQTLTPLPDGAAIKITTAHYLTPSQRDINLKGIAPDVSIAENADARLGEIDKDAQLRAAIALLQKKIAAVPTAP